MNELESSVYSFRDKLSTSLSAYITEADKESYSSMLTAMEDWLYDEGMDTDKNTYIAKLKELTDKFAGPTLRASEAENRPSAISKLEETISRFEGFIKECESSSDAYDHIAQAEKDKVASETKAAAEFLADAKAKLEATPPIENPPIKASELLAKASALDTACTPIVNTPKPIPKPPEPEKPAEGAAEGEAAAAPADAEAAAAAPEGEAAAEGAPAAAPAASQPDNMDVD